ncbi:hypothetical protein IEQ34_020178 [Dendrobium chrysotoxum]|uniref:Enoyl reductase (ER) domain-containing protein n=1 Tax=Dendrobium chrysotoxum TaxID=161865 RepID=A0AAV7FZT2_DENCH|nr:hypothetical protein IEQ34_020178 [Dendrobium chrysotoxum]
MCLHVEVLVPSPKKDEVLLKLEAASLNPVDWKTQEGNLRPLFPPRFPFIPEKSFCAKAGCSFTFGGESGAATSAVPSRGTERRDDVAHSVTDVAGEVIEVGSAVKSFKAGDKVVSMLIFMKGGGLAEYAVASSSLTVHRPPEVSPAEGAGLPIAASTALQALKTAGAKFDGTEKPLNILITAASGGVGHYAVQLAKLANLHVTATCGARNIDLVKSLGADEVLDYKSRDGEILHSPSGKKYDAVIQCTTGVKWSVFEPNLSENGRWWLLLLQSHDLCEVCPEDAYLC